MLTIPSSWTVVRGISASMSITLAIDAGMASYFGWGATGAAEGAGRDAARAAAIDGAAIFLVLKNQYLTDLKISGQVDRRWYRCKISYQSEPNRTHRACLTWTAG